ncbi:MAG: hypothetical protein UE295_06690, partial [Acutalibacteraceae bacterium]|nr:hypothetical protein [Acutalibacteraceae bacterium]
AESSATEPATQSVTEVATTAVEDITAFAEKPTEEVTTVVEESIEDMTTADLPTEVSTDGMSDLERREKVDDRWLELSKTEEYKKATHEKQAEMIVEFLEELILEGCVKPDSIDVDKHSTVVAFRYMDGSMGSFWLRDSDSYHSMN